MYTARSKAFQGPLSVTLYVLFILGAALSTSACSFEANSPGVIIEESPDSQASPNPKPSPDPQASPDPEQSPAPTPQPPSNSEVGPFLSEPAPIIAQESDCTSNRFESSGSGVTPNLKNDLDSLLGQMLTASVPAPNQVPGFTFELLNDSGDLIYSASAGKLHAQPILPYSSLRLNKDTRGPEICADAKASLPVNLASTTKGIFGLIVLREVTKQRLSSHQGARLTLTSTPRDFFSCSGSTSRYMDVPLHQLLSYTAGIPDVIEKFNKNETVVGICNTARGNLANLQQCACIALNEAGKVALSSPPSEDGTDVLNRSAAFEPGKVYTYAAANNTIIGAMAEVAYNKRKGFAETRKSFLPMTAPYSDSLVSEFNADLGLNENDIAFESVVNLAGSISASAQEMRKISRFLLKGGVNETSQTIIAPELLKAFSTPFADSVKISFSPYSYMSPSLRMRFGLDTWIFCQSRNLSEFLTQWPIERNSSDPYAVVGSTLDFSKCAREKHQVMAGKSGVAMTHRLSGKPYAMIFATDLTIYDRIKDPVFGTSADRPKVGQAAYDLHLRIDALLNAHKH